MKAMVESALPLGSLASFTRPTNLALLNGVEVFRIDQPLTAKLKRFQALCLNQRPYSAWRYV